MRPRDTEDMSVADATIYPDYSYLLLEGSNPRSWLHPLLPVEPIRLAQAGIAEHKESNDSQQHEQGWQKHEREYNEAETKSYPLGAEEFACHEIGERSENRPAVQDQKLNTVATNLKVPG